MKHFLFTLLFALVLPLSAQAQFLEKMPERDDYKFAKKTIDAIPEEKRNTTLSPASVELSFLLEQKKIRRSTSAKSLCIMIYDLSKDTEMALASLEYMLEKNIIDALKTPAFTCHDIHYPRNISTLSFTPLQHIYLRHPFFATELSSLARIYRDGPGLEHFTQELNKVNPQGQTFMDLVFEREKGNSCIWEGGLEAMQRTTERFEAGMTPYESLLAETLYLDQKYKTCYRTPRPQEHIQRTLKYICRLGATTKQGPHPSNCERQDKLFTMKRK